MNISLLCTVTAHCAVFPFSVTAVITALPAFLAVTLPSASTAATLLSLLLHITVFLLVVLSGIICAINLMLSPSVIVTLLLLRDISVIGISGMSGTSGISDVYGYERIIILPISLSRYDAYIFESL